MQQETIKKIGNSLRRKLALTGAALGLSIIHGCAFYDLTSKTDTEADFSTYSSFAWIPDKEDSISYHSPM